MCSLDVAVSATSQTLISHKGLEEKPEELKQTNMEITSHAQVQSWNPNNGLSLTLRRVDLNSPRSSDISAPKYVRLKRKTIFFSNDVSLWITAVRKFSIVEL